MSTFRVAHLDEIEELDDGREPYRPVRHHFGITSFGVTAWTARNAGDRIINEHDEDEGNEELYLVMQGHAVFELDGERVDAPAGTFVSVSWAVKRTAYAEEAGTTILALGASAGQAYEPDGWELWMPLGQLYKAGKYEAVVERGHAIVAENPHYALPFYNLACCESLTGRTDDALEHLQRAIELSERFREYARGDTDLDAVRDDPRFKELVGG